MPNQQDISKQVDATMDSLENVRRAAAPPFLYTRIKATLDASEKRSANLLLQWLTRPVVAYAIALLVLFFNLWVLWESRQPTTIEQPYASEYGGTLSPDETLYSFTSEENP